MKIKKILLLALLCSLNFNYGEEGKDKYNSEKIIFENCGNTFFNDTNDSHDSEKGYSLMIKLNYDELQPNQFITEDEKNNEYNRLKKYYSNNNQEIAKKMELDKYDNVYISKYSNYISVDATEENINDVLLSLVDDNNVDMIYVNENIDIIPNYNNAIDYVNVANYIETYNHDASGIVVGILEPGILDQSHSNFSGCDVTVRNEWYFIESIDEHTTMMGSIIGGVNGIAKNCKLLSVQLAGNAVSEIDWLLENNVNIINCSYGDENPTGKYTSKSAYMDYISYTYKVTFVVSAGNTGTSNTYVANPGLSYNAITVGSCSSTSGYCRNFSSYTTVEGPRKPNIVAPGYNLSISPFSSLYNGTSFSSAITTGCVALLMKQDSTLKYNPQKVSSLIMAGAQNPDSLYFGSGLDEHVGAGSLDYQNTYENLNNTRLINFTNSITSYSLSLNFSEGEKFKAVLSSLVYSDGSVSSTAFTNYDMYLYDENNNIIESQSITEDTIELLEVEISNSGQYTLRIIRTNSISNGTSENISVSYVIY